MKIRRISNREEEAQYLVVEKGIVPKAQKKRGRC